MSADVIRVASRESREAVRSFRDLRVWQLAMSLAKEIYMLSASFPQEEKYGLTSQIKRSAISVPSNIAEGSSRRSTQEFIRYVNIATGSLAELETQLLLAIHLSFVTEQSASMLVQQIDDLSRMLQGLHDALVAKTTRLATRDSNHEQIP